MVSRCAHSPVQVSRNFTAPLTYSFVRPQVAGEEAAFGLVPAVGIVGFVGLESPFDLAVEPPLELCNLAASVAASDAAAWALYMTDLIKHSSRLESALEQGRA
jgi:hypothetical protein